MSVDAVLMTWQAIGVSPSAAANNLQREAPRCAWLILWLDCDREGENIAFEVMEICLAAKPGRGGVENKHSADVESTNRVGTSV